MKVALIRAFIKNNKKFYFALIFCTMICFGTLTTFRQVSVSLEKGLYRYLNRYDYYDGVIQTAGITEEQKNQIADISGIRDVSYRYITDSVIREKDGKRKTLRLIGIGEDENHFYAISGGTDGILCLSAIFAERNQISPGDFLQLYINGKSVEYEVKSLINSPELSGYMRNEDSNFEMTEFGCAYMDIETLQEAAGVGDMVDCLVYHLENQKNEKEIYEKICGIIGKNKIIAGQYGDDRFAVVNIKNDIAVIEPIADILPLIMYLLGCFFTVLFMRQFIQIKSMQIGIMRANGFSFLDILSVFGSYSLMVALGGSVLGVLFSAVQTQLYIKLYEDSLLLPSLGVEYSVRTIALAVLFAVITNLLGVVFNIREIFKGEISAEMNENIPASTKIPWFVRKLPECIGGFTKMNLCSICRRPLRFILSIVCITFSVMLIMGAFAVVDSKNNMIKHIYEKRYNCDYVIYFHNPVRESAWIAKQGEGVLVKKAKIACAGKECETKVSIINENSDYLKIYDLKENHCKVEKNGIIISEDFAKRMDIEIGDELTIWDTSLKVANIAKETALFSQYMSFEQYEKIAEKPKEYTSVLWKGKLDFDSLFEDKNVEYVNEVSLLEKDTEIKFAYIDRYVHIIATVCVILGGLVIYNMSILFFSEKRRTNKILRMLGISKGSILLHSLTEVVTQYLISGILGIPLGYLLARYTIRQLNTKFIHFSLIYNWRSMITVLAIVFLFVVVTRIICFMTISKEDKD